MTKPLDGIRVLELAGWAYVPCAGVILADWGADVIKIEPPSGDPVRGLVSSGVAAAEGIVYQWEIWNRNKRSVALDLAHPEGPVILGNLVDTADVLLTNYLPAVRTKLGVDEDTVRARNPSIVYGCGTARGAIGPAAEDGGFDSICFWSRGGVSALVTPTDYPKPLPMPAGAFGDSLSGMALAGGIAAALAKRQRTGEGSVVDGSLLGTAMWAMQMSVVAAEIGGARAARAAQRVFNPLVNTYHTSDERWIGLCMMQSERYWEGICRALGRDDLIDDPLYATAADRTRHRVELVAELDRIFATRSLAEWSQALAMQSGPWDVVREITELHDDEQALANGMVQKVEYSGGLTLPLVSAPVHFDHIAPTLGRAPEFGADTDDVLLAMGMTMEQVLQAKIAGAVV